MTPMLFRSAQRTGLSCHSLKMMAKAGRQRSGQVVFDLEDGCALSRRLPQRKTLVRAFNHSRLSGKIARFPQRDFTQSFLS